ncbi:MAG: VWA domain-containing protein [Luteolibacter sp.]
MNFQSPYWLLACITLPILALAAVLAVRFGKRPWEQFSAERLRGKLVRRAHPLPGWLAFGFALAAICALAFTMARPQGDAGYKTEKISGRNVMIALDLSRSMRVKDVAPDRLAQGKIVIYELLEKLQGDRIGLIGFAGTAFLSAPLTIDHAALKETVEQIDEEWVSMGGSDISLAVKLATDTLKETGQKNNLLIVISDGEDHEGDLDTIIADAERSGVTIFAIGVGSEDGGFVPHEDFPNGELVDRAGNKILSRLKPDVMRKLANETGGKYVMATGSGDIPTMIAAATAGMESFEMEGGKTRIVIEFFQWVLLPAIFFLMASILSGTRWRGIGRAGVAVGFLIFAQNGLGDQAGDAREAFADGRFDEARDGFRELADEGEDSESAFKFRLGEGLAAYEGSDFRGARSAYSEALLSEDGEVSGKAHEGMGNTLFQLGWMGLSGSEYGTGENTPDLEEFEKLVQDQLKRMGEEETPESGETNGYIRLEAIIVNWADAIFHYKSAISRQSDSGLAKRNGALTMKYLKKLEEILDEEQQNQEQMMQQMEGKPQPGDGEGQEGEGDEQSEGSGGDSDENGEGGDGEEKDEDGNSGNDKEDEDEKPDDKDADEGDNPNETPEEKARRILSENADVEKGSLNPGRREFRRPDKDW